MEINLEMHAMNDALYGVPKVASTHLERHTRVGSLLYLIRALAHFCSRRPRLSTAWTKGSYRLHGDQIRCR